MVLDRSLLCTTPQAFDSAQLGAAVARLDPDPAVTALPPAELDAALGACVQRWLRDGLWLVSCRLPADAVVLGAALGRAGFHHIETLVTLRRPLSGAEPEELGPVRARPAEPADLAACAEIAASAFRHDRFHADPRIPRDRADALKVAWVRNGLGGRADAALVVREAGRACGFALCLRAGRDAVIDLIAVAPAAQGRGVGRALVDGVLAHYGKTSEGIVVSTQASNAPSLALYAAAGFARTRSAETHHWIRPDGCS